MHILTDLSTVPTELRGAAVAIGNFDGVHRGHQAVIGEARRAAEATGRRLGVVTFEPHPRQFFHPDSPPFRLTPFPSKMHALKSLGCDMAVSLRFDAAMAAMPADEFIAELLVDWLGVTHVVAGYDFVFGHDRKGNLDLLRSSAWAGEFEVTSVGPIRDADGTVFSSTAIRERLIDGDVQAAAALLGRPWEIEGPVLHGDELGRTIDFPTANVALGEYLRPAAGIYVTLNGLERRDGSIEWIQGVASIGSRPTVGGTDFRLETFLFDFDHEIYGKTIRVRLLEWLRPELKFEGLAELREHIGRDVEAARDYFAKHP